MQNVDQLDISSTPWSNNVTQNQPKRGNQADEGFVEN